MRVKYRIFKNLILGTFFLAIICITLGTVNLFTANASEKSTRLIPKTNAEYVDGLTSPIATATDGSNFFIIKNSQTLIYYFESTKEYRTIEGFTSLGQVAITEVNGKSEVWFSDNGSIYGVPYDRFATFKSQDKDEYRLTGGNFFSVNQTHLLSVFKEGGDVYKKGNYKTDKISLTGKVDGEKPVALTSSGTAFYFYDNKIVKNNVNDFGDGEVFSNLNPSSMVANDQYLFLISDYSIYKIDVQTKEQIELSFKVEDAFDLGKCNKPKSLSFKGENLLITDSEGSVQEFTVDDDKLIFTGFAIAKGKTAFNRVSSTASDVERYGDITAVLDDVKLTIIKGGEHFNPYSRSSFLNLDLPYFEENGFEELPIKLTLGDQLVLIGFSDNTASLFNIKSQEFSTISGLSGVIKDLCYQSGTFYLLATDSTSLGASVYSVYELKEGQTEFTKLFSTNGYAERITVDVFKNVFVSTGSNVIKHLKKDNYVSKAHSTINGVKKLCSDLGGNLFALTTDGNIQYYQDGWKKSTTDITNGDLSNFSLAFDRKEVTLLKSGQEIIYLDSTLPNSSITDIKIPSNYVETNSEANTQLKFYTVSSDANVYEVYKGNGIFDYKGLANREEEYLYLATVSADGFTPKMLVLLGKDRPFLVNDLECSLVSKSYESVSGQRFITTGVNAYHLPVISRNDDYVLKDGETVRLNKGDVVDIVKRFTFLERDYYLANVTVKGKTYQAYLPENFTAEILSEAYTSYQFTLETLNKTTMYKNSNLTEKIADINGDTTVRVFEKTDGKLKIALLIDDVWVVGYVDSASVINYNSRNIKNAVVISVLCAVICASGIFILIKKKKR